MVRISITLLTCLFFANLNAQFFEEVATNTIQTHARVDTFVVPDVIFLEVVTHEKESAKELNELEQRILSKLKDLDLDSEKVLSYTNFGSKLESKLFGKEIKQTRKYELRLNSAEQAIKVISALNELNIGRISLSRYKYSKEEELKLELSRKAILKARDQALALTEPIGQTVGKAVKILDLQLDELDNFTNSFSGLYDDYSENMYKAKEAVSPAFKKIKFVKSVVVNFELK